MSKGGFAALILFYKMDRIHYFDIRYSLLRLSIFIIRYSIFAFSEFLFRFTWTLAARGCAHMNNCKRLSDGVDRGCPAKNQRETPLEYGMQAQAKTALATYNSAINLCICCFDSG